MVSVNPNSPEGFYLDANGMALPGLTPFATPAVSTNTESVPISANAPINSSEDASKKVRKPYTISKSRESWTEPEHDKFLEALQLFDRDWKKIEAFVGSKTVIQIRSHAQKYFLKVQKSGSNEHLPPPRPKRKAAHPYPQKAPKVDSPLAVRDPNNNATLSPWTAQTDGTPHALKGDVGSNGPQGGNNCTSSVESTPMPQTNNEINKQTNSGPALRVLPDFAQVYSFIGSVFDPGAKEHVQRLKKMDPIDVETVLLLMRNLSINLASPDFEDHRRLLASYEIDPEKTGSGGTNDTFGGD